MITGELAENEKNFQRVEGYYTKNTYSRDQIFLAREEVKHRMNILLDLKIKSLSKEREKLQEKLSELSSLLKGKQDPEFEKLTTIFSTYEQYTTLLLGKITQININKSGIVHNFQILSEPYISPTPIKPVPMLIYSICFSIAFIISACIIIIKYYITDTIGSAKEIEIRINNPLLGVIPEYRRKMKHSELIIREDSKTIVTESLRSIRATLDHCIAREKKRTISITSTISREGKTFTSINLGGIIALSGVKTIIVDLDLRFPALHHGFKSNGSTEDNKVGVSDILRGRKQMESCIKESSLKNLDFIPSGPPPPNPSELLLSDSFNKFIEQLKEKYDTIVFDTPPVGLITDALTIMKKVDIKIYIMRSKVSKLSFITNINRIRKIYKLDNINIILNGISVENTYSIASYAYHYGQNYLLKNNNYGVGYLDTEVKPKPWWKKHLRTKKEKVQ